MTHVILTYLLICAWPLWQEINYTVDTIGINIKINIEITHFYLIYEEDETTLKSAFRMTSEKLPGQIRPY